MLGWASQRFSSRPPFSLSLHSPKLDIEKDPMKVLLASIPMTGHSNPILVAARILKEAGQETAIYTSAIFRDKIEKAGIRFIPLAVELPERDANRGILVRRCEPVFVLLCDAEELLHLIRSGRCRRPVRIEWPCELAEEAVEFL